MNIFHFMLQFSLDYVQNIRFAFFWLICEKLAMGRFWALVTMVLHVYRHTVGFYEPCQNHSVSNVARTWCGKSKVILWTFFYLRITLTRLGELRLPDTYEVKIAKISLYTIFPKSRKGPSMEHWVKWLFVGFWKDGLLAKWQTKTSRSCIFLLFLPHKYHEITGIESLLKLVIA